jgi:hypothetical protein
MEWVMKKVTDKSITSHAPRQYSSLKTTGIKGKPSMPDVLTASHRVQGFSSLPILAYPRSTEAHADAARLRSLRGGTGRLSSCTAPRTMAHLLTSGRWAVFLLSWCCGGHG